MTKQEKIEKIKAGIKKTDTVYRCALSYQGKKLLHSVVASNEMDNLEMLEKRLIKLVLKGGDI